MAQNITKGIKALMEEANEIVATMSIEEAKEKAQDPSYVFVDLRDIRNCNAPA